MKAPRVETMWLVERTSEVPLSALRISWDNTVQSAAQDVIQEYTESFTKDHPGFRIRQIEPTCVSKPEDFADANGNGVAKLRWSLLVVGQRPNNLDAPVRFDSSEAISPGGGQHIVELSTDEAGPVSVKTLRQDWDKAIQPIARDFRQQVIEKYEESPNEGLVNMTLQCNSKLQDFADSAEDDNVHIKLSALCVVYKRP